MSKATLLRIINPLLLLLVISQGITGMFPAVVGIDSGPKFQFAHVYLGLVLIALALLHLGLNWSWVRTQYGAKRKHAK